MPINKKYAATALSALLLITSWFYFKNHEPTNKLSRLNKITGKPWLGKPNSPFLIQLTSDSGKELLKNGKLTAFISLERVEPKEVSIKWDLPETLKLESGDLESQFILNPGETKEISISVTNLEPQKNSTVVVQALMQEGSSAITSSGYFLTNPEETLERTISKESEAQFKKMNTNEDPSSLRNKVKF